MPESVFYCLNLLPLGIYLTLLGLIHVTGRSFVTTGVRDYLALVLALSGPVVNGPIAVLLRSRIFPLADTLVDTLWGGALIYLAAIVFLTPRPYSRLVIYNVSESSVAAEMEKVLDQLAVPFQSLPGGWLLSEARIRLDLEAHHWMHNVTLEFRGQVAAKLFQQIREGLSSALELRPASGSVAAIALTLAGTLVLAFPIWHLAADPGSWISVFWEALGWKA